VKILIYALNYAPELTGIGKYNGEMAEWLATRGHDVRVITAPPYYPKWAIAEGYSGKKYCVEFINGVKIYRTPLWVPSKPSGLKRLLHLVSFALASFPTALAQIYWRPDVIMNVEPPLICASAGLMVGRIVGAANWLHVQDFEVDAAFALGLLKSKRVKAFILWVERMLMRRFDWVTSISDAMVAVAASKGVASSKLGLVYNWVGIDEIVPSPRSTSYRKALDISESQTVALYSGNMGNKQGLEILSEAAALLKDDHRIRFVFCGDGSGRRSLELACKGLENVDFLPLQPFAKLNDLLASADIHLLPQRSDAEDLVMPSKLLGMLASGRPVVATANRETELGQVVEQCGLVVPPGDGRAFASALLQLAGEPERGSELGAIGRAMAVTRFSKSAVLGSLEERLLHLKNARAF
jgi:colanic acid biosynthesis glycosyl transferase WcaI